MGCSKSIDGQNYPEALTLGDLPSSGNLLSPSIVDSADSLCQRGGTVLYIFVSPRIDAKILRRAMSQMHTDRKAISKILGARTSGQMKKVAEKYHDMYDRFLKTDFERCLYGKFLHVCIGRLCGPFEYEAYVLHNAVTDTDTDETAIVDVLCTKTNREIKKIKEKYTKKYRRNLVDDIKNVIDGNFQNLIVLLLGANREDGPADLKVLASEAKELRRSRNLKKVAVRLLTERSFDHLRALFKVYQKTYRLDLETAIRGNTKGSFMSGMLTIVKFVKDPLVYYSSLMYGARNGGNNQDEMLIRCILSRCEVDMWDIKIKYYELWNVTLDDSIWQNKSEDWIELCKSLIRTPTKVQNFDTTDILDTTFSKRRRVFRGLVEQKQHCDKSELNDLSTDKRISQKTGYFAGTLRHSDSEENKSGLLDSFASHFHISLKHLHEEKENSKAGPSSTVKKHVGSGSNSKKSKINVRRAVYGKSTDPHSKVKKYSATKHQLSNDVDDEKPFSEATGGSGTDLYRKQKTMVGRNIKVNLQGPKPEDSGRVSVK